jgi:hypothetical protein
MHKFLQQSIGQWKSYRTYFYPLTGRELLIQSVMDIEGLEDNKIEITWESYYLDNVGKYSEGDMILQFDVENNLIIRDKGYFTNDPTTSEIILLDNSYLKTQTKYGGKKYIEEINIYNIGDKVIRRRFTRAYDENNKPYLIGNYFERKL